MSHGVRAAPEEMRGVPREPLLGWLAVNTARLGLYLGAASLGVAMFTAIVSGSEPLSVLGLGAIYFLYGGYFGIPGTVAWLLLVAYVPPEWPARRRRLTALASSPLIQIIWLV